MTRRGFLFAVIGGLLAAAGFSLNRPGRMRAFERTLPVRGLSDLFTDIEAAAAVGVAYLRTLKGDDLLPQLLSGVGIEPHEPRIPGVAEFHARRKQDFLEGETLLMEGWIMARSELCACGLLAYSRQGRGSG